MTDASRNPRGRPAATGCGRGVHPLACPARGRARPARPPPVPAGSRAHSRETCGACRKGPHPRRRGRKQGARRGG